MECREYEREISRFIHDKMNFIELKHFISHTNSCPDCKEELVIKFLIEKGLTRLEEGNAFDLQKELQVHVDLAEKRIKRHEKFVRVGYVIEIILMLAIAIGILWILI